MTDSGKRQNSEKEGRVQTKMIKQVAVKEERKIQARRQKSQDAWFGLGVLGVVGWSVMVPTLLGLLLGLWIDAQWPGAMPWTVLLLLAGLFVGCVNAWLWVMRQQRTIEREREERKRD